MRVPWLRRLAALALSGALLAGTLAGCGKGAGSGGDGSAAASAGGITSASTKNTTRLGGDDAAENAAAVALAVYPGLTAATRPQAVVLVDRRNWAAALAAAALAGAPLGAPLLYTDGDELPEASAQALRTMRPLGAASLGGAQVIQIATRASVPAGYRVRTLPATEDPAAIAAAVGELFQTAQGHPAKQAIVTDAQAAHALQMPAAGLSAQSATPILLVSRAGVPPSTTALLRRLHRPTIYVVSPATVSSKALSELRRLGTVVRIVDDSAGDESPRAATVEDPVDNAIAVARFQHGSFGWGVHEAGHGLVFANAAQPLDGPAAASLSAHGDFAPLLLLATSASVPPALAHYLSNIEPGYTAKVPPVRSVYNHGWLIGDEQAISALAQAEIDAVLETAPRKPSAGEEAVASAE
jgi:hypothetical protein